MGSQRLPGGGGTKPGAGPDLSPSCRFLGGMNTKAFSVFMHIIYENQKSIFRDAVTKNIKFHIYIETLLGCYATLDGRFLVTLGYQIKERRYQHLDMFKAGTPDNSVARALNTNTGGLWFECRAGE